ncbi:MAG TPA: glycosyltransferase family 2 protein [Ktedonobacteraceae bacterium]|nr:glycosyltransferase family 2 protein [Ktedonobacteraceae bacterium]
MLISLIGIRFLFYFQSFFLHWSRYRHVKIVTNDDIRALPSFPFIKIQITTRGSPGSTEVIRRGVENVLALVREAPDMYGQRLIIEVITESHEQKLILEHDFSQAPIAVQVFVLPPPEQYQTPNDTKLKARALHYMVELRRRGLNRRPGKTFIVHYDEESVMEPGELRKLIRYLATTDKLLTEGPIYYPLEYGDASVFCRAMEANRPIGCFECREVMESGTPLHLHGSNLVIDEALENDLGWDIGNLDGQPFIAEDYVFGVLAYLKQGPQIFGWHGCVMLEQPPFSFKSAFKQRYRWIIGVLQGMTMMGRMPEFRTLSRKMRFHLIWGTRYRVLTFAFGLPAGVFSFLYVLLQTFLLVNGRLFLPLPLPVMAWMLIIGFLWLNSIFIGSWYNISNAHQLSRTRRLTELGRVLTLAPIAGILESTAGSWAVIQWTLHNRKVNWQPTPKTKQADNNMYVKRRVVNHKIAWRLGVACFVLLLTCSASFQWLSIGRSESFLSSRGPGSSPATNGNHTAIHNADGIPDVRMRRPDFQTGMIFPQWGGTAYSSSDANWHTGLKEIQDQTAAQWIELPVNFYQASMATTQVMTSAMTPTPDAVAAGIRAAHAMGYHVFVVPLLTVEGPLTWSGSIKYNTVAQTQAWFTSYFQAYEPYIVAANQAQADQLAIGTEDELLQEAPPSLWDTLIGQIHAIFAGKLTYDINWSSLYYPLPPWLRNPDLSAIGVSVYNPLTDTPQRLDPAQIPALWQQTIRKQLDDIATQLAKPLIISEIGYRNSAYALYRPWERDARAMAEPPDPVEQAAAYNAALSSVLVDPHISGIFFWGWSLPPFDPNFKPAAAVMFKWFTSSYA